MLSSLSYSELVDWIAYYSIEPFPEERQDLRNALLATTIINLLSENKVEMDDLLFDFWKDDVIEQQSPKVIWKKVEELNLILNNKG
jgi:hypothetical protein